jgi:hypothetical protein
MSLTHLCKLPRKLLAAITFGAFVLVAGWTMGPDKLSAVTLALVAIATAFITGHALTDIRATQTPKPTPPKDEEEGS